MAQDTANTDYILRNLPDQLTAIASILTSAKRWSDVERVTSMLNGLAKEISDDNTRRRNTAAAMFDEALDDGGEIVEHQPHTPAKTGKSLTPRSKS